MAQKRPLLTPAVETTILAYVRAGGFAHVAAEAAGVSREDFEEWMRKGDGKRQILKYRLFAVAVRQAEAQARLGAEVAALKGKPVDWLKAGPGKETAAKPGWSALAKPRGGADKPTSPLLDPGVQDLLRTLLRALERYPDARAEVVGVLNGLRPASVGEPGA
jgi:hypothetical protein